jgi:23S rRNA pseudouridine1911/1915/1917 synthase
MRMMEAEANFDDRVLLHTTDVIVVNKLAGEAMEGAGKGMTDLPALLAERFGGTFTAVHRLDVPVSGCALFARSPAALAFLSAAFAGRKGGVTKTYWAVTEEPAFPLAEHGELVHWIRPGANNRSLACPGPESGGKRAALRYRMAGRGERYLFLEIDLITGRHHQIRAQLAACGIHIKGDLKYGSRRSERTGGIRLHAHTIIFPDPAEPARPLYVSANPPAMDALWRAFATSVAG